MKVFLGALRALNQPFWIRPLALEQLKGVAAELCVLHVALHYAFLAYVDLRFSDCHFVFFFLNLAVFGFVLADIGWVGLACMRLGPGVSARGKERCRFLPIVIAFLLCKLLIERLEETRCGSLPSSLTLAFDCWVSASRAFFHLCLSNLAHFSSQIRFVFFT